MHTKLKIFTYCLSSHGQRLLCPPPLLPPPLSLFCCCTPIMLHTFGKICQAFFLAASLFYFFLSLTALYHTRKSQLTLVSSSFQAVQFVWHAKGQRAGDRRRGNCIHLCHFNAFMHSLNVHPPRETWQQQQQQQQQLQQQQQFLI